MTPPLSPVVTLTLDCTGCPAATAPASASLCMMDRGLMWEMTCRECGTIHRQWIDNQCTVHNRATDRP